MLSIVGLLRPVTIMVQSEPGEGAAHFTTVIAGARDDVVSWPTSATPPRLQANDSAAQHPSIHDTSKKTVIDEMWERKKRENRIKGPIGTGCPLYTLHQTHEPTNPFLPHLTRHATCSLQELPQTAPAFQTPTQRTLFNLQHMDFHICLTAFRLRRSGRSIKTTSSSTCTSPVPTPQIPMPSLYYSWEKVMPGAQLLHLPHSTLASFWTSMISHASFTDEVLLSRQSGVHCRPAQP